MEYSSADYVPGGEWPTKRDRAELLLVALASLLIRGGERLTLLGSGIAPMSGRIALSRVAEMIGRHSRKRKACRPSSLCRAPRQLVLIGDFLSPLDVVNAAVARFAAAGLKGHMLQVVDPAEEDLPFDGRVRFEGVEERDQVVISRVESIRSDYSERFQRHREGLAAIAAAGRLELRHSPHRPAAASRPAGALCRALGRPAAVDVRRSAYRPCSHARGEKRDLA